MLWDKRKNKSKELVNQLCRHLTVTIKINNN